MSKDLIPSIKTENHVDKKSGDVIPAMYREGRPRGYRFNASTGILNLGGDRPVSKAGAPFRLIPLSMRIFRDDLFEKGRKTWCEIFFLNAKNQLCVVLFHGFSVENLADLEDEMFYEGLEIGNVILTVSPQKKESKAAEGSTYYIAAFSFEEADEEVLAAQRAAVKEYTVFRHDTWNENADLIVGYKYPAVKIAALLAPPAPKPQPEPANADAKK